MKALILVLLCSTANAKDFTFTYHYPYDTQMNEWKVKVQGADWKEAHEKGAFQCLEHYLNVVRLNEDTKVEIANVCTNPH